MHLKEAINSILNQSYENFEIIFWDNQSTDKSADIIKSFTDKRIKYYYAPSHTSLYKGRNEAVQRCTGSAISFLDCDDIWTNNKLELQVQLYNQGCKFIYGAYENINSTGERIDGSSGELYEGKITNNLLKRNPLSIGCVLIDRELLIKNKFDDYYDLLGDYDLWVRLSIQTEVKVLSNILEYSRQHNSNTSNRLNDKWVSERRYFYRKNFKDLKKYSMYWYYLLKAEIRSIIGHKR